MYVKKIDYKISEFGPFILKKAILKMFRFEKFNKFV